MYRLAGKLGFSGTTDALNATVKTFSAYGPPIQRDYLFSHDFDWDESIVRHNLGDLSPSEKDRAIVTESISSKQIEEVRAKVESLTTSSGSTTRTYSGSVIIFSGAPS